MLSINTMMPKLLWIKLFFTVKLLATTGMVFMALLAVSATIFLTYLFWAAENEVSAELKAFRVQRFRLCLKALQGNSFNDFYSLYFVLNYASKTH